MAGAPRKGNRFVNPARPRPLAGLPAMFPFFLRKTWTSIITRSGAARLVPFDRAAMQFNPSITWIGHSTMLVRVDGVTFLTDPIFSDWAGPLAHLGPKRHVAPGVPLNELPLVDFAVLSHDHYDHTDLPSIAALAKRGTRFIVPLGLGELVHAVGGKFTQLDWWQTTSFGNVRVHCVPAQHFCGRSVADGNRRLWAGWIVEGRARRFYHAGDSGYFPGFTEIGRRVGPIDLAALPIGAYDPPSIMRFVHLNPEEAIQAAVDLGARRVIAMHFGTFDLTDEPMDEPPSRFHAAADRQGWTDERAWTLNVGETRRW
jgi:N-acyl-phosphatidylethanolamine-hydrolysing phospholipase D